MFLYKNFFRMLGICVATLSLQSYAQEITMFEEDSLAPYAKPAEDSGAEVQIIRAAMQEWGGSA